MEMRKSGLSISPGVSVVQYIPALHLRYLLLNDSNNDDRIT